MVQLLDVTPSASIDGSNDDLIAMLLSSRGVSSKINLQIKPLMAMIVWLCLRVCASRSTDIFTLHGQRPKPASGKSQVWRWNWSKSFYHKKKVKIAFPWMIKLNPENESLLAFSLRCEQQALDGQIYSTNTLMHRNKSSFRSKLRDKPKSNNEKC